MHCIHVDIHANITVRGHNHVCLRVRVRVRVCMTQADTWNHSIRRVEQVMTNSVPSQRVVESGDDGGGGGGRKRTEREDCEVQSPQKKEKV